jgi:hypothetical protein
MHSSTILSIIFSGLNKENWELNSVIQDKVKVNVRKTETERYVHENIKLISLS